MSFEEQATVPEAAPETTTSSENQAVSTATPMPSVELGDVVAEHVGSVDVAEAGASAERLFELLEEEAEEDEAEEALEESGELESDAAGQEAESASSSGAEGAAEAEAASGTASQASSAGAGAGAGAGLSSGWVWGGLGLAAAGAAASGGGGGTSKPKAPTLSLVEDSGADGDGITNTAVFNVGELDSAGEWEYSLDGGSTWNAGSGTSFEIAESGTYSVVVRQSKGNKESDNSNVVEVQLDNVAPVIESGASASVNENNEAGAVVYAAEVTEGQTTVTYSLGAGSDEGLSVDTDTGAVSLVAASDFESKAEYSFTLVATDAAGNSAEQAVTVNIANLDEVAPTFTSAANASVNENVAVGTVLYTATVDDTADISAGVSFSLAEGSDAAVAIDASTGEVSLLEIPDHETKTEYVFTVVATDEGGNSSRQAVTATVVDLDESAPTITSVSNVASLFENSGANQIIYRATATDTGDISGGVTFSLKPGSASGLRIDSETGVVRLVSSPDFEVRSTYNFTVVATDAAGNSTEKSLTLRINDLDEIAPEVVSLNGDSASDTVVLTFDEALDEDVIVDEASFAVSQGGIALEVLGAAVAGNTVTLTLDGDLVDGPVQVVYTPGDAGNVRDTSGNELGAFTQMVVSDGYIRGARVYLDANNDGIAQESELLEGVTTDANGQVIIDGNIGEGTLLIVGGINTDTGAVNKIVMKTAAGNTAANPLTTLVETIKKATGKAQEEAEAVVTKGLGITLAEGQTLANYDPLADTSDGALAARKAVATVAVILATAADAGADEAASNEVVNKVAANIATQLVDQVAKADAGEVADAQVVFTAEVVNTVLKDESGVDIVSEESKAKAATAATDIEQANDIDTIVVTQAVATDTVAPDAPVVSVATASDLGFESDDGITSDSTPQIFVDFDETNLLGGAVVVGDLVEVLSGDQVVGTAIITLADISAGGVGVDIGALQDGDTVFTARITDKASNVSELAVAYTVTVDTSAPIFSSGDPVSVDENDGSDIEVYTAVATDNAAFVYSLNEDADAALSIDSETGVVTLAGADFESAESYEFSVIATDIAGNVTTKSLVLQVNNLDEVAPEITSAATATAIDENSGADQVIYTVTSDDTADISGGVVYSLGEGSDEALSIDVDTGAVSLSTNPDFETQSVYKFTVIATDAAGNKSELDVLLDITDLDEIAPTITSAAEIDVLPEGGTDVAVYTVTSDDSADTSAGVTYSLKDGSDAAMAIDADTGVVTLTGLVDFESQEIYNFTVVATDGAGNASEQALTLTVGNVDEVAPTITSADEIAAIDENTPANQVIYDAEADDSGDISGGVTFSLADGASDALSIDSETGVVTLTESPDYEALAEVGDPAYTFTVVATDAAGNETTKTLTLAINDLDEGPPVFTSPTTATAVDENTPAETVVYTTTATDGSPITYSLSAGDDVFSIDADTGEVRFKVSPDAEVQTDYSFTVVATDTSDNADSRTVTLKVNDVDDLAPVITSAETLTAVDENVAAGTVVYTVEVDDSGDVSDGVSFTLGAGSDPGLELNLETGEVSLVDAPDHEAQSSYDFTVVATDAAGNETTRDLTLTINDLDEATPTFTSGDTINAVDENAAVGTVIYTAVVDDTDDIESGITFSLSDDSAAELTIDADTGEVSFATSPDFEALAVDGVAELSFTVVATDGAGNEAVKSLTVVVNDLDEGPPVFISDATADPVNENVPAGTVVYTAEATDGSKVTYSLDEASQAEFTIDADSGEVSINASPDAETKDAYTFTVIATDEVGNSDSFEVSLAVTDLDDVAPTFVSSATDVALTGTPFIYDADAVDTGDDITVEPVQYSLDPNSLDAALLDIDFETGVVTLKDGVLVEGGINGKTTYSFTVLAFDGVNDATPLAVSVDLSDITQVTGSGVLQQGGIRIDDVDNGDGSLTLKFFIDDSIIGNYETLGAFQFELNYDPDQFEAIEGNAFTSVFSTVVPNTETAGVFGVGAFTFPEVDVSAGDPLGELVVNPLVTSGLSLSISNAIVGTDEVANTVITYGDLLVETGTAANETFVLNGGESEITGGDGIDAYVITATTGDQTLITDFMHEEDIIDMTQLLLSLDYTGLSEYDPAADAVTGIASEYEDTSLSVLDLIAQNDSSLDNVFGMVVNQDTGVITGFYDSNSDADVVEIETFEINIGSAVADVTLDDLTAGIGGFIA